LQLNIPQKVGQKTNGGINVSITKEQKTQFQTLLNNLKQKGNKGFVKRAKIKASFSN